MADLACMIMPIGPVGQLVEIAQYAEQIGCRRLWIPDEGLAGRDCYVTLAAVAGATHHITIGTGITNPYTRHPGVTASAVATLDEHSNGRAALGVGAGGGLTLNPLGINRRQPLTAVRELIETSRALWSGNRVQHSGVAGNFSSASVSYGRADIPIWVAGRGPKMMALGGQLADGFILSFVHKELLASHVATIRQAAVANNRPPPTIAYMTALATDDASFQAVRASLTFRLVDSPPEVKDLIGMSQGDTDALRSAISQHGPTGAAHLVRPDWVQHFAIVGSPAECQAELGALMTTNQLDEFQVAINNLERAAEQITATAAIVG